MTHSGFLVVGETAGHRCFTTIIDIGDGEACIRSPFGSRFNLASNFTAITSVDHPLSKVKIIQVICGITRHIHTGCFVIGVPAYISSNSWIVLHQAVNTIVIVAVILTAQTDFIRCNGFAAGLAGHVIDGIFTGSATTFVADECTGRGHRLDFVFIQHGFRRNGDDTCLGIHSNTFRQVGAFPFATGRVFVHHDFMVCLDFVFIGDSQFIRTGRRGHGDAALFGSCGNTRRLRCNRRHVGDGASACGRSGLIRCCGIQR